MTARKIKHARMLAKREAWFKTVNEGNYNVLSQVRSQREQEAAEAKKKEKDQKVEKSKRLAAQNGKKVELPPGNTMRQKPKGSYKARGEKKAS